MNSKVFYFLFFFLVMDDFVATKLIDWGLESLIENFKGIKFKSVT